MPDEYQVLVHANTSNKRVLTHGNIREFVCVTKDVNTMEFSQQEIWSNTTILRE
jgi:hypothetical protein